MKYSIEISKIIEGALKLDNLKVNSYTQLLIDKLKADGEAQDANRLSRILDMAQSKNLEPMNVGKSFKVPVDTESRVPIADTIMPLDAMEKVVFSEENSKNVDVFLLSYKNSDKLNAVGVGMSNTLLMYGPPGCGKTKTAHYIASKLNLPLVIARLDSMISSYLGTTSKNIRYLFEYAQKVPCVLFLDEFDAIAKARDDENELGELKRVVNSLLQNIDNMSENSLLIAATNHEELLDKAIWRRFDYKLKIDLPDRKAREALVEIFLGENLKLDSKDRSLISIALESMSGSDIEELIKKAIRKSIIFDYELSLKNIFDEIFEYRGFCANNCEDTKDVLKKQVRFLRELDEKIFSYIVIGNILGISKAQVGNILKG
ncbi:AAA family ATPase [Asaccharospora irregularis]|uniref:ATPase family associated with various cellular activities (AAA) n=1 Tax=Asaccharospora irregularis DSM 2635 TaxID=1121321 RepID=A0A1M5KCG0_9FIRM|nr:ATP-binding protein [Asaccharospora irregularis]SHG50475.1 ATPase family associated with various cellular activities (AAA) [Asaccharospora irregularis DSM 2635]